jgi:hypothetical protein
MGVETKNRSIGNPPLNPRAKMSEEKGTPVRQPRLGSNMMQERNTRSAAKAAHSATVNKSSYEPTVTKYTGPEQIAQVKQTTKGFDVSSYQPVRSESVHAMEQKSQHNNNMTRKDEVQGVETRNRSINNPALNVRAKMTKGKGTPVHKSRLSANNIQSTNARSVVKDAHSATVNKPSYESIVTKKTGSEQIAQIKRTTKWLNVSSYQLVRSESVHTADKESHDNNNTTRADSVVTKARQNGSVQVAATDENPGVKTQAADAFGKPVRSESVQTADKESHDNINTTRADSVVTKARQDGSVQVAGIDENPGGKTQAADAFGNPGIKSGRESRFTPTGINEKAPAMPDPVMSELKLADNDIRTGIDRRNFESMPPNGDTQDRSNTRQVSLGNTSELTSPKQNNSLQDSNQAEQEQLISSRNFAARERLAKMAFYESHENHEPHLAGSEKHGPIIGQEDGLALENLLSEAVKRRDGAVVKPPLEQPADYYSGMEREASSHDKTATQHTPGIPSDTRQLATQSPARQTDQVTETRVRIGRIDVFVVANEKPARKASTTTTTGKQNHTSRFYLRRA